MKMNALTRVPHRGWNLLGDFDGLANGFFAPVGYVENPERSFVPAIDIVENENAYEVRANLPGVKKGDLSVSVKDDVLTIEAKSSSEDVEKEGERVIKLERRSGNYLRTLRLGKAVDSGQISADYTDGVLKLTLPKAEDAVSRQIDVAVH
jgi:HSP20 family protein